MAFYFWAISVQLYNNKRCENDPKNPYFVILEQNTPINKHII